MLSKTTVSDHLPPSLAGNADESKVERGGPLPKALFRERTDTARSFVMNVLAGDLRTASVPSSVGIVGSYASIPSTTDK